MSTRFRSRRLPVTVRRFPLHGWIGLALALTSWLVNWGLPGTRTYWAFFPLWLGYCLAVDGLVVLRTGTSLLTRSARRYAGLFALSAPMWWLFEAINLRTRNWIYLGADQLPPAVYAFWTTICFSTVLPAVLGSAELAASFKFVEGLPLGPRLKPDWRTTIAFFVAGCAGFGLLLAWPQVFFPFTWLSIFFILEPINVWLGNRSLSESTRRGDWRPVCALWLGVLLTAFFWEMWNYFSYPKWIYVIPWGDWLHVFEMPLLGYGGYLPFALELYALYHFAAGLFGQGSDHYIQVAPPSAAARPL